MVKSITNNLNYGSNIGNTLEVATFLLKQQTLRHGNSGDFLVLHTPVIKYNIYLSIILIAGGKMEKKICKA